MQKRHNNGRWIGFPKVPTQDAVCEWLFNFQKEHLSQAPNVYHTTISTADLTGAEARRQLDLLVKRRSSVEANSQHDWDDVCVVGELKQSLNGLKATLLQLSMYIHDLFSTQPTRRFAHGFFIQGTIMELWGFDRSGAFSSGEFDIHQEPEQFIQAIVGYSMMSHDELGLDTSWSETGKIGTSPSQLMWNKTESNCDWSRNRFSSNERSFTAEPLAFAPTIEHTSSNSPGRPTNGGRRRPFYEPRAKRAYEVLQGCSVTIESLPLRKCVWV